MRNVRMIRTEPDLLWIRLERAVYCETCEAMPEPWNPGPAPAVALAA